MNKLMNLIRDEEGATAIEYGLIAALIAAGIVTATTALGEQVVSTFDFITGEMKKAATASTATGDTGDTTTTP
ncbi:Flp family type IVb pilin [Pseudodesulfovibrio indicus]|uniref:Flp family type IVb pilin n=1 Tax=Pseudodesulfovibrio indicus TaxID=1716143 RepID=UPI00292DC140|nr:Flp family type IVb pilin [Pseudodesulfovibrio indicus]